MRCKRCNSEFSANSSRQQYCSYECRKTARVQSLEMAKKYDESVYQLRGYWRRVIAEQEAYKNPPLLHAKNDVTIAFSRCGL